MDFSPFLELQQPEGIKCFADRLTFIWEFVVAPFVISPCCVKYDVVNVEEPVKVK